MSIWKVLGFLVFCSIDSKKKSVDFTPRGYRSAAKPRTVRCGPREAAALCFTMHPWMGRWDQTENMGCLGCWCPHLWMIKWPFRRLVMWPPKLGMKRHGLNHLVLVGCWYCQWWWLFQDFFWDSLEDELWRTCPDSSGFYCKGCCWWFRDIKQAVLIMETPSTCLAGLQISEPSPATWASIKSRRQMVSGFYCFI